MPQSVFVNSENKAIFTCPQCTKSKTVDVSKILFSANKINLKIKCPCGNIFPVRIERRKFYRKETNLRGVFLFENNSQEFPMIVNNISRSGIQFTSSKTENLKLDDQVLIQFRLDDKSRSLIKKKGIIRRIEGMTIGIQFLDIDDYDKILGFYLFK
jgi:hypothetical protein